MTVLDVLIVLALIFLIRGIVDWAFGKFYGTK